ncbi:unnamed protein product [Paramecium octaurelia]|uniref:N-acetylglucosaminylphosphatidylinositol deacetylase n=1 Tax=Paramecium octaurelia TaxID=43137 RepID=A0A8S1V9R3_PAROT|nr:unnamed protein product [Paramecium octaurelia]
MEVLNIIEEIVDDDLLFIQKYGLLISNFITIFILLYIKSRRQQNDKEVMIIVIRQGKKSVLLVTVHLDDEAMFFLPTITYLNDNNLRSSFNIKRKCQQNRKNMRSRIIEMLQIPKHKQTIINDENLQDSLSVMWPIEEYIAENNIKGVITFDEKGISGHLNHIACYNAIFSMKRPEGLKAFPLETTNILRKYSSILDFFVSSILNDNLMVNLNIFKAWRSMQIRHSQFVWYRKLFVVFSRYSYINTLIKI